MIPGGPGVPDGSPGAAGAAGSTVADLSEGELLARILPLLGPATSASVGPGDDAAVLRPTDGPVVISVDTLVEDHDFRLTRPNGFVTTGFDVGWKSAAQNLSDINAMGGRPTALVVSLTLPGRTPVAWVEDCARGFLAAITELGAVTCSVVGGDLGAGEQLVVTAAVTGTLDGPAVLRSGATAGDVVAVAGTLGRAAAGLALLEDGRPLTEFGDDLEPLVAAQLRPCPLLAAGPAGALAGATAMLDISDGLVRDAGRIATASGVQMDLDPDALGPFAAALEAAAARLGVDPMDWVMGGGEDHGLLATFPPNRPLPPGFAGVGSILPGTPRVTLGSRATALRGWDHFAH